ncbi:MAG: protein involved in polysaccharide export with SLBB domain [Verrucomicrobiales bacterium]|jgi:protein involved in polysaccharide export with SLBB domain
MKLLRSVQLTALAVLGLSLLLSSCAVIEGPDYNPRAFTGGADEHKIKFMTLDMNRRIDPADLKPTDRSYRVGAGDVLKINIVEVLDTDATTMVMPDGKLYYDVARGVPAVGRTLPELEKSLATALKDAYPFPIVNINTVRVQSATYSVMGQVVSPGVYELPRPTSVLDAISLAGGVRSSEIASRTQNLADLRRSVLLRDAKIIPVDFESLVERGDMTQNVYLKPGDYLYLPTKGTDKVYVLGNVRTPRAVPYSSDLTFVKALAIAGGPMPSTFRKGLLLVRGATTPDPEVAPIDVASILNGNATDFHLQPGDVIWVPKSPWEKLQQYATAAVDSAVSTIAIQEAAGDNNGGGGNNSNSQTNGSTGSTRSSSTTTTATTPSGETIRLDISTGPES